MAGRLALILLGFTVSLLYSSAFNSSVLMKDYPTPFTKNNRVLGCLLAFNFQHIDPIAVTLNEYTSMCEAGWDPTMVFFTTVEWSDALIRYLKQKTYCYRLGRPIHIKISQHSPSIGTGLSGEHRAYMANVLNEYDVFVYHEDDIMFKLSHLVAYLHETKLFHELMPENGLWEHTIGFQRYRRINRGNDFNMPYGERDIFEQELLEETPEFVPVCVKDKPYIHVQGNIHQAMWVFTRQQVIMLQERCSFLNQSSASREYMSSFSLFDRKKYHCGLTKLLPSERLYTFAVLHYYQQRHVSWTPVIMADENVRAGFHSRAVPRSPISMPACWDSIVKRSRQEQNITSSR